MADSTCSDLNKETTMTQLGMDSDALIRQIQTRRTEIGRIIDALPALDEMGEAAETGHPGAGSAPGKGRSAFPSR